MFFVFFSAHADTNTNTHQLTQEMHKIVIEHMKECVANPYSSARIYVLWMFVCVCTGEHQKWDIYIYVMAW